MRAPDMRQKIPDTVPGRNGSQPVGEEWPAPTPLDAIELPAFPIDALEPWMGRMVAATATALQVPADLPGMLALTVLATAFQRRVEAVIRPGWHEPLSAFTLTAAEPGERKSATFSQMVRPINAYEAALAQRMAPEIAEAKAENDILSESLERLKKEAAKAKPGDERDKLVAEAKAAAVQLEARPVVAAPRLTADDTTTERMAMLLADQGGRMALLSPEGDPIDMMAGRYQDGIANIGVYLKGHAGDDHKVDRVGRPSVLIPRAAISMGLTIQPDVLLGMTANTAFRGRGLLARFLYAVPKSMVGDREIRPEGIPEAVTALYAARLQACLETPADADGNGSPVPHLLLFTAAADDGIAEFEHWLEPQLRPGAELGTMGGWASKLAGAVARIAALLHCSSLAGTPDFWKIPVDGESVARARQLAEYLIPHAQAAFLTMGCDPAFKGARAILGWIERRGAAEFAREELRTSMRSQFARSADLDEPLQVLVEHGFIRQREPPEREGPGRSPSPHFEVHPSLTGG